MPDSNRAKQAAKAVSEQTDRYGRANNSGSLEWHVVEKLLRREDLRAGRRIGGRSSRDGTDGVFLETPWPRVHEFEESNPQRQFAVAMGASPTSLKQISAWEYLSPAFANKETNDNDESALNGDLSRLELWK